MRKMNSFSVFHVTLEGKTQDGAVLERWHGCNDREHVDLFMKVFYGQDKQVEYAEDIIAVERGECDGYCDQVYGGDAGPSFMYPRINPRYINPCQP